MSGSSRSVSHTQHTLRLLQAPGRHCYTRSHIAAWMNQVGHHTVQGKPWTTARLRAWLRRQRQWVPPQPLPAARGMYPIWDSQAHRSAGDGPAPTAQIHGDPLQPGVEWTAVVEAPVGAPAYGHGAVHIFATPTAALEYQYACLFAPRRPGAARVYECRGFWEPAAFMCAETLYDEVPPGALWDDCAQGIPGLLHQLARYYWDEPLVAGGEEADVEPCTEPAAMWRQLQWLQQQVARARSVPTAS